MDPTIDMSAQPIILEKICQIFSSGLCNRVLLVNPPNIPGEYLNLSLAKRKRYFSYPPVGLALLSSWLKKRGYVPKILDLNFEVLTVIDNLGGNDELIISDLFEDRLRNTVNEFAPDAVGINRTPKSIDFALVSQRELNVSGSHGYAAHESWGA